MSPFLRATPALANAPCIHALQFAGPFVDSTEAPNPYALLRTAAGVNAHARTAYALSHVSAAAAPPSTVATWVNPEVSFWRSPR